jgi:replicative superfamily II helicase
MDNTSRRTSARQHKPSAKMAELKQQTLKNAFNKQERAKKATLKKEKKRFTEIYKGVSRKRSRILNRLSGLKRHSMRKRVNSTRRHVNDRIARIKKSRNTLMHKHRTRSPPKNERNELASLMRNKLVIHDGGAKRRTRKCKKWWFGF